MKGHVAPLFAVTGVICGILWLEAIFASQAVPLSVVINEVAWGGTDADSSDEWIELFNNAEAPVDLAGWMLTDGDNITVTLSGLLPPGGFFLLERTNDCTVSNVAADRIYTGNLHNEGERLELYDAGSVLVDTADGVGGWPAGSGLPDYRSMERIKAGAPDSRANWASHHGQVGNGLDCNGEPLHGTPRARNSTAYADLHVQKRGPLAIQAGFLITYTIAFSNAGYVPAQAALLTDVLPSQVEFLTHTAPYPFSQPEPGTLVWQLGTVPPFTATQPVTFAIAGLVDSAAFGELANAITITSATSDSLLSNNHDLLVTMVASQPVTAGVLIESVYADTYRGLDDEAFRLVNVSQVSVDLAGWRVTDGEGTVTFPPGASVAPGGRLWCSRESTAFLDSFGFLPDYEWAGDHPGVADLAYMGALWLHDHDDELTLLNAREEPVDVLVYGDGVPPATGWTGPSVQPYSPSDTFPVDGQILYRKLHQATGLPVPDSDSVADWAQDPDDPIDGRKVQYPGWDLDDFFFTQRVTETATLTVTVAPDNVYETLSPLLARAEESIWIESYTFRSRELADVLLDRLDHGVTVTLLLEGSPAFDGVTDQEKWVADQLRDHGANVLFMVNDSDDDVHDRYKNAHAKLIIVDGALAIVGSENLNNTGIPADPKGNGTAGRRGAYIVTDAPGVVARVQAIFEADADPYYHDDVVDCDGVPGLCTPPAGFEPEWTPDWMTYTVQFPAPLTAEGTFAFEVVQSPENSLRTRDSLLGLLARAGPGDTVQIEEFFERLHWGPSGGDPETDPNPRLEAILAAARQDATVRILLDGFLDAGGENAATVEYLLEVAQTEGLDLQARLGNPTYLGLHNKMALVHIDDRGYVHVGSINGGEASSKVNRELALQVQSDEAYTYLQGVFDYDWRTATPPVYLPAVFQGMESPPMANYPLISEVYYAVGQEREWVEILNPTSRAVDLSSYKVGDAQGRQAFEGMYRFPPGTVLGSRQVLVVASTSTGFRQDNLDQRPDLEIFGTDGLVPDMLRYATWGEGDWHLANGGDQVLLLDGSDRPVDVVAFGDGAYPGVVAHPGVSVYTHSLERFPARYDTGDCSVDFRDWAFPSPGELPDMEARTGHTAGVH
jgi:uncharacterized repeat protein (TIGR01451 family)